MNSNTIITQAAYCNITSIIKSLVSISLIAFALTKLKTFVNILHSLYNTYRELNTNLLKANKEQGLSLSLSNNNNSIEVLIPKATYIQIFTFVNQDIESKVNISNIKQLISSSKKEELMHNWVIFKESELISFYYTLILPRYLLMLTFSCIILSKEKIDDCFIAEILNDNWNLVLQTIEHIESFIINSISNEAKSLQLNIKVSYIGFEKTLRSMYDKIMVLNDSNNDSIQLGFHMNYLERLSRKINELEESDYDPKQIEKMNQFKASLYFYRTYYDILSSNCFQCFMLSLFNLDYECIIEKIASKANSIEKTIAQFILYMDEIRVQMLNYDTSMFSNESKAEGILSQYRLILNKL